MSRTFNCAGQSRRDCLKLGLGAAVGGFGLTDLFKLRAASGTAPTAQADACILVWLDGGPSHYETFDPKPTAPSEIRGDFGTVPTKTPGVFYSEQLKRLASLSDQLAVVRSIRHDQGNHGAGNHYMMTGAPTRIPVFCGAFVSFHPSLGSVVASEKTAPEGMPAYFTMPTMSRSGGPNFLGAKYAPFVVSDNPNTPNFRVRDVNLPAGLDEGRFSSRRDMRQQVDRLVRIHEAEAADPVLAQDEHYEQGVQLIASTEAQAAFDVDREPASLRDAYGRTPFGQRALLARRLVEAGVPFVTLYEGGWDHHRDLFNDFKKRLPSFENTIATLIEDLRQRGRLERTLIVVLGEFGRTPQINKDAGRDHWSNAMSVMFAGGGTPGGLTVGSTDPKGYAAMDRVLSPENFAATVYAKLGIDPGKILYAPNGRPVHLVSDPTPITELMG
jgi:hypothetical protein